MWSFPAKIWPKKMPKIIASHDVLGPLKPVRSASRDVIISCEICGSKSQRVFTLGDGCRLPKNCFCTGAKWGCAGARGFVLPGSKRPLAPSPKHFWRFSLFGQFARSAASQLWEGLWEGAGRPLWEVHSETGSPIEGSSQRSPGIWDPSETPKPLGTSQTCCPPILVAPHSCCPLIFLVIFVFFFCFGRGRGSSTRQDGWGNRFLIENPTGGGSPRRGGGVRGDERRAGRESGEGGLNNFFWGAEVPTKSFSELWFVFWRLWGHKTHQTLHEN